MARKKRSPRTNGEVQELVLTYQFAANEMNTPKYIDLAQSLSKINRKLFRQGMIYEIESITAVNPNAPATGVGLAVLPCNWVTRNAWVKAHALWKQMNLKVLSDNPSVQGKWADFKLYFDGAHFTGGTTANGPTLNKHPVDLDLVEVLPGEWNMSTFVLPQHDVDPTSGEVLAADQFECHMLGANLGSAGAWTSVGAIQGYADTRSQVQAGPLVPGDMSESWMTQLTDDGSQEPELADNIENANDSPPYDADDYPGAAGNNDGGTLVSSLYVNSFNQKDMSFGHRVPLGLLKVLVAQVTPAQGEVAGVTLIIKLRSGSYNGVTGHQMRQ